MRVRGCRSVWTACAASLALAACEGDSSEELGDGGSGGTGGSPGPTVTVLATGLVTPYGIEIDAEGNIWVAEQGTGNQDSRISVVTADGRVHPVLEGLESQIEMGNPEGVQHLALRDQVLWATQGLGSTSSKSILLQIDVEGFAPGDPPLMMTDAIADDLGPFVLDADPTGTGETNIYNLAFGPGGDLFIVDAGANAVLRRTDATGENSVFAVLPEIENSTSTGPPMMEAVPTAIVFDEDQFLVSAFPGFPFPMGGARIFSIDLDGTVTVYQDELTNAVDLTFDPDGNPVILQYARGSQGNFASGTGSVIRLAGGAMETLLSDLDFPTGVRFAPDGDFFVSESQSGRILRVSP